MMMKNECREEEARQVHEPGVAYETSLDSLKQEAVAEVLKLGSSELLTKAVKYLRRLKAEKVEEYSLAQMTLEELKASLEISKEELKTGKYLTQEEVEKRKPTY